jgi:AraC family transcriptional regulator
MQPQIVSLAEKKMVGKCLKMSIAINKTAELWRSFMPRRKEISNQLSTDLFSLQIYPDDHFKNFDPHREFEKWALAEVADFNHVPAGMATFTLPGGLYAVFIHRGDSSQFTATLQFILGTWLPQSGFLLDNRPHFEVLGERYRNNDPSSEEEVWIPIKPI